MKIMMVDDKLSMLKMVGDYLAGHGYTVVTASNGRDAMYTARHEKPDLILLDIMMPEMDGYEFIRQYRKESQIPIILLTARLDEADKVVGLELGADDYVTKPFGMAELVARIRAVMRRVNQPAPASTVLRIRDLVLDRDLHQVTLYDEPVTDIQRR
jgi:DNA-binding response OmpR family regulator